MNKLLTSLSLGLALLAGQAAQAQATPEAHRIVLAAGLVSGQENTLEMTHKTSGGYAAEAGYQFSPKDYGADFLVYAGWKKLPAATASADRSSYEMAGPHFGFDVICKPWETLPLTLSTGPSAHIWHVQPQGISPAMEKDQGLKLGWRVGLRYALTPQWGLGLKYTLTEWRSSPDQGIAPCRPAYISFMADYRF